MKKYLLILCLLPGCAILDLSKFDTNEYEIITDIRIESRHAILECGTSHSKFNADRIAKSIELFEAYTEYLPHNEDTAAAAKTLNQIAQGLVIDYKQPEGVSEAFCKTKFETIENSAEVIQHVIGSKPR